VRSFAFSLVDKSWKGPLSRASERSGPGSRPQKFFSCLSTHFFEKVVSAPEPKQDTATSEMRFPTVIPFSLLFLVGAVSVAADFDAVAANQVRDRSTDCIRKGSLLPQQVSFSLKSPPLSPQPLSTTRRPARAGLCKLRYVLVYSACYFMNSVLLWNFE